MANIVESAKVAFADTFSFYLKTHYYHWNVEGNLFPMIHEFFEKIYSEVYGAVDPFAEFIRTLGAYAPGTLLRMAEITNISQSDTIPSQVDMIRNLLVDNDKVIGSLIAAFEQANASSETSGFANFLQDRIAAHKKHEWMLKATLK
jgi:starvation-inducible DNA-binding protein